MRSTGFIKPKPLNPPSKARITTSKRVSDLLISTVDSHVDAAAHLPRCDGAGKLEHLRAPWPPVREGSNSIYWAPFAKP
jgi:hypothetical protein